MAKHGELGRGFRRVGRGRRAATAVAVFGLGVMVAACQPVTLGVTGTTYGNDPSTCEQFQPVDAAPCGPQPKFWASISGPAETCANGDPFASKLCATYRTTGYAYAVDVGAADVGTPLTVEVYDVGTYTRTVGTGTSYDCNRSKSPFNVSPYTSSSFTFQACQAGDSGGSTATMDMDLQLYGADGSGGPSYVTPVEGCHFARTGAELKAAPGTYKNKWVSICTFTPSAKGVHALRVRSSGLPGMDETAGGLNSYALRVTGASATTLQPIDDASVWLNAPTVNQSLYLGSVPSAFAGKRLMIDLYDPGDGPNPGTTPLTVQVKAPPGGSGTVPDGSGTPVPSPGVATSCRYNATPSATPAPETVDVADACAVVTQLAATSSGGIYNGKWLRIEVTLDPAYTCTTDCRWTLEYHRDALTFPTDRMTYSLSVV